MKVWQILFIIWGITLLMMIVNHFHRQNIERMKKKNKA